MILTYLGHSFWSMALENAAVVAFDPYGSFYGYPKRSIRADLCLVSHHHHDHDGMECIQPGARVIDKPGVYSTEQGVSVKGVATAHDDRGGAMRGANTFFVVETEGLRVGHAGDLGHVPTQEQAAQIGPLDVLLLPVGGYYTIDAKAAAKTMERLRPKVTIPMHYQTQYDREMPIAPVEAFLALVGAEDTQMPLLRITKADIAERPRVLTLAVAQA